MTDLLDFTGRDLVGQKREHGRNGIGRKDNGIGLKSVVDARNEVSFAAFLHRRSGRPPVLVISATQELGKLCPKLRCLFDHDPVAHCLQYGSKEAVRTVFVVPSKSGIEVVDPNVCQLEGVMLSRTTALIKTPPTLTFGQIEASV